MHRHMHQVFEAVMELEPLSPSATPRTKKDSENTTDAFKHYSEWSYPLSPFWHSESRSLWIGQQDSMGRTRGTRDQGEIERLYVFFHVAATCRFYFSRQPQVGTSRRWMRKRTPFLPRSSESSISYFTRPRKHCTWHHVTDQDCEFDPHGRATVYWRSLGQHFIPWLWMNLTPPRPKKIMVVKLGHSCVYTAWVLWRNVGKRLC